MSAQRRQSKTPTVGECVREELDCVCGVHGYKLFAEFDYVCESCGSSEYAEFHGGPIKTSCRGKKVVGKHIRPSVISSISTDDEEVFLRLPYQGGIARTLDGTRWRSKSAPPLGRV